MTYRPTFGFWCECIVVSSNNMHLLKWVGEEIYSWSLIITVDYVFVVSHNFLLDEHSGQIYNYPGT